MVVYMCVIDIMKEFRYSEHSHCYYFTNYVVPSSNFDYTLYFVKVSAVHALIKEFLCLAPICRAAWHQHTT